MQVKLNKNEELVINSLPVEMRQAATTKLLADKQAALVKVTTNRKTFSSRISDDKLIVYGLGNRFPVTLRADGWNAIISNIEAIKAEVAKLPKR